MSNGTTTQDPSLTVSDVKPSGKERALGVLSGILSGGAGQKPGESALDQAISKHHQMRLDEARMHRQNAATYAGVLATGINPKTGQPLTPEEAQQYKNWYNSSWAAYEKAAGVSKEIKPHLRRAKNIIDHIIHRGQSARQEQSPQSGSPQGASSGEAATLTEGEHPPQGASPGLAPPPKLNEQPGMAEMSAPAIRQGMQDINDPRTVTGASRFQQMSFEQRRNISKQIGLDENSLAGKEFLATGKFPAAAHLQAKLVKTQDGQTVTANYDPSTGQYTDQEGTPIPHAQEVSPSSMTPKRFTYIGPDNQPLIGMQVGSEFFDQMGNKLPPNTQVYTRGAVPTDTLRQVITYDAQGNPQINTLETIRAPFKLGAAPPSAKGQGTGAKDGTNAPDRTASKRKGGLPPPPKGVDAAGRPLGMSSGQQKNQSQRATTLLEGIHQIFGNPQDPNLRPLKDFSYLADDSGSRERIAKAWNVIVDNAGLSEETEKHGPMITLAQAYLEVPQALAGAMANVRSSVQKNLKPDELAALDATVTSFSAVVGWRTLTGSSAAQFSVKALERDVPIIGNTAVSSGQFNDKIKRLSNLANTGLGMTSDLVIPQDKKDFYRKQMGITTTNERKPAPEPGRKGGLAKPPKGHESPDEEILRLSRP